MVFVKNAFDIARKKVFFCDSGSALRDVARVMHKNNIGSILVRRGDDVAGIITVNDMLRHVEKNKDSSLTKAEDIMSSPVIRSNKNADIETLTDKFNRHRVSRMVLEDDKGKIVGVVRDIAVHKYMTLCRFDKEVKRLFSTDYHHKLY